MEPELVEIEETLAAATLELCDLLSGPIGPEEAAYAIRVAEYVYQRMIDALAKQGLDPDELPLPAYPPLNWDPR
jgi:hypothetical protein